MKKNLWKHLLYKHLLELIFRIYSWNRGKTHINCLYFLNKIQNRMLARNVEKTHAICWPILRQKAIRVHYVHMDLSYSVTFCNQRFSLVTLCRLVGSVWCNQGWNCTFTSSANIPHLQATQFVWLRHNFFISLPIHVKLSK